MIRRSPELDGLSASEGNRGFGVASQGDRVAAGYSRSKRLLVGALQTAGIEIDGAHPWDIQVNDARFYDRVLTNGSLGLGEAYVEGWWDCEQVDEAVRRIMEAGLEGHLVHNWRFWLSALKVLRARTLNFQSKRRAAETVKVHYDLGVELFRSMLGPTMVYSCAYWKDAMNLDRAQEDKLDLICRKLQLSGSDRFLDVGCGWGGLLKHVAAHFGCPTTGITNSANQYAFSMNFCEGLPVSVLLSDYRDPGLGREGRFNKIACIGMFEHVGAKNYHTFMKIIDSLLTENGLFLLQTVGRCKPLVATDPWLDKYIFPNGMLPSAAEIVRAIEGVFVIEDWHSFGADYDRTLMAWHANFEAYAEDHGATFSEGFLRMWRFYLLSCAGSFRAGCGPKLWQVMLSKSGIKGSYRSVR
jgi:cyclopropane-fatty-acyl-phospholipid synthase